MSQTKLISTLVAALLTLGVTLAVADTDADRCAGSKTKAAAKYAKVVFSCHARALRKAELVDPSCIDKAVAKLTSFFDKAELAAGCVTSDDEDETRDAVDATLTTVAGLLDPDPTKQAQTCASSKLRLSGRGFGAGLGCYGKAAIRSLGPDENCFARTEKKLISAFRKAEARGGCTTVDDYEAIAGLSSESTESLVRSLSPVCGDALLGPAQECEAPEDAACPGLCNQSCICVFPPECGDGVAELPEECDDSNLADGDGCSSSCQLEDASALCTGVASAFGEAIDAIFLTDDLTAPTFLTAPPLDAGRLFITEREGYIRILNLVDNTVNATPFLDINALTTTGGERGLFSMAFDPDYENNRRFFISYTNTSGDLVLARYEVEALDPDLADESTRQELLAIPHPGASNHNGGQIQFGGDGYLYWSMGDGGSGLNSQSYDSLLGGLLRIDVTHDSAPFVSVPPTNPNYVDGSSDAEYVWSKGLRNPWRFSFDRDTGDLYIGDVGAGDREEVSFAPASSTGGENYGWNIFEGNTCNKSSCPDPPTGFTFPIHDYPHTQGCAVMGGYVYRGCALPDLAGSYFFSDLCSTFVNTFEVVAGVATNLTDRTADARSAGATFTGVISWGEDARGEIYIITGNNRIYRIEPE